MVLYPHPLYNKAVDTQILFSVVIPTYDRERFLKKCVDSVLAQTYTRFEVIIVDDGSRDGTKDLIASYDDNKILYTRQDNKGVSRARNKGLELAKGDFVAFLDSDDWWSVKKLERSLQYILDFPDINIFHTDEIWYRNGNLLKQLSRHKKPTGHVYRNALPICCISISTAVIKKTVFDDIGTFDEDLEACEDYDFWLRATNKYEVKLIPEDLTLKDGGRPDQLSSSVWGLDRFRIKALGKMLASNILSPENSEATLDELRNKCEIFAVGCEKHGKTEDADYYRSLPTTYQ
ncbi:MAG: glycosyltransferase [Candidatus Tantalella remota]|nr:glycosyltransferase [Candidatus Tantalella remota]